MGFYMDFFKVIDDRHSYRGSFTDEKPVSEDLIKIVKAGIKAPSGCNGQTTEFVIVDDESLLEQIRSLHPRNKAFQQAKALIACVIDKEPEPIYQDKNFVVEDCAAAVENMLLAITALGYASVWIDGWLRSDDNAEKIGKIIHVPDKKIIRIVLPIGKPAEEQKRPEKRAFDQRAWFNKYPG